MALRPGPDPNSGDLSRDKRPSLVITPESTVSITPKSDYHLLQNPRKITFLQYWLKVLNFQKPFPGHILTDFFFFCFWNLRHRYFSLSGTQKIVTQKTSEIPGSIFKYSQAIALDKNLTLKNLSRWRTWSIFGQVWLSWQRSHLDENLVKFEAFKNVLVEPTSQV